MHSKNAPDILFASKHSFHAVTSLNTMFVRVYVLHFLPFLSKHKDITHCAFINPRASITRHTTKILPLGNIIYEKYTAIVLHDQRRYETSSKLVLFDPRLCSYQLF